MLGNLASVTASVIYTRFDSADVCLQIGRATADESQSVMYFKILNNRAQDDSQPKLKALFKKTTV